MFGAKTSKNRVYNKIKRWTFIALSIIIICTLAIVLLFALNKDRISAYLLSSTNNIIQGEVTFDDISLSPFIHFPYLTITVKNVNYFEKVHHLGDSSTPPIINLSTVHVGLNIRQLTKGNVTVSSISIENGIIDLVSHTDSTLNLINAFKKINKNKSEKTLADSINTAKVELYLKDINIKNVVVSYKNELNGNFSSVAIENLTSWLQLQTDSTQAYVDAKLSVLKIPDSILKDSTNINVAIQSSVNYHSKTQVLTLNETALTIMDAVFNARGNIAFGDVKTIDLAFDGSDTDMSFFNLFLKPLGVKNIKSGDIYFKGKVKGGFSNEIPRITCNFGIINMCVKPPKSAFFINDLNLKGSFNSGIKKNFATAALKIDTLWATLPDGHINGRFLMSNFKNPKIDYYIDLKTRLDGVTEIIKTKKLTHLRGNIKLTSQFKGQILNQMSKFKVAKSDAQLSFDNLSFNLPNLAFKNVNGVVSGNLNALCFNNLSVIMGNSDITIDGTAQNVSNLILKNKLNVVANLRVSSKLFDLADFLKTIPSVGKGFPYQILDLKSDIKFTTNREQLFSKKGGPHFVIENFETNVTINNLLPPVKLQNGVFKMTDSIGDQLLTFNNFDISFNGGKLLANVIYHSPWQGDRLVNINAHLIDVNPSKLIYYNTDTVPTLLNGVLNGFTTCTLSFPSDTNLMFSQISIDANHINYQNKTDNYQISHLKLTTGKTNYDSHANKNLLATLSSTVNIEVNMLKSNQISFEKASCSLAVSNDTLTHFDYLLINAQQLIYNTDSNTTNIESLKLFADKSQLHVSNSKNPFETLTSKFDIELTRLKSKKINLNELALSVDAKNGEFFVNSLNSGVLGTEEKGRLFIAPFKKPIDLQFRYEINQFNVKNLLSLFRQDEFVQGKLNLFITIEGSIKSTDSLLNNLSGKVELSGENLVLNGIDIDDFLKKVEKTQNFNLVDAGAFMLAGPVGLVVTKGTAVTQVLMTDKNAKSQITQFKSAFDIKHGVFTVNDMAFASVQNRIASKGWLNLNTHELMLDFAVVDKFGCSKLLQNISGPINKPKVSDLEVISSLLAPVTNLYDDVVNNNCTPFYTGSIKHPVNE